MTLAHDRAGFAFVIDGVGGSLGGLDGVAAIWQTAVVGSELARCAQYGRDGSRSPRGLHDDEGIDRSA